MILLIDLCYRKDSLGRDEFVLPIARIVQNAGKPWAIGYYEDISTSDVEEADRLILCGTALKDQEFIGHLGSFQWLKTIQHPVLGICAGMQIMVRVWGGRIVRGEEIGMTDIRVVEQDELFEGREQFSAFELHNYSPIPPDSFRELAASSQYPQVIRHRILPHYGVLFHPEVRNEWVVERFLNLPPGGMH